MKNFQRLAAILLLSLGLLACSGGDTAKSEGATSAGEKSVQVNSGDPFPFMGVAELESFLKTNSDKPTMLMFWTTWCPSCKEAFPDLDKLAATHGDIVNVISISLDDKKEALTSYFKGKEPSVPVYFGDQALAAKFDVQAIPTMVFFNKSGEAVFARPGAFPYDMLAGLAKKLASE